MTNTFPQDNKPTPFKSSDTLDLPFHWDKKQLKEIANVRYGKARPEELGEIPVIGSGGVYASAATALVEFPTLIIGRKGTAGMVWLQEQPCWPSDTTFYLEWKNATVDYHFLYYALLQRPLSGEYARTTLPSLLKSNVENYTIAVPPQPEQHAIVRTLRAVQEAKATRQREIEVERERKAALMEHLFTNGTQRESTKQTEIGEMPEGWKIKRLSQVCAVKTSFPPFNLIETLDTRKDTDDTILALKVSDMNLQSNQKYMTESRLCIHCPLTNLNNNQLLKPHSVIFPKRGAAIGTNKKRITKYYSVLDPNLIGVEPSSEIDVEYLHAFFERFDLMTISDNTPIPQLNKHQVENILLPSPELSEQHSIAFIKCNFDNKIEILEREATILNELFKALSEELMSGRLSTEQLIEVATDD